MTCAINCGCSIHPGIVCGSIIDKLPDTVNGLDLQPINCGIQFFNNGNGEPRAWYIDITQVYGNMVFYYVDFAKPDRFILYMDGKKFFDSGCLGTDGWRDHTFYVPKRARRLWIEVRPNCTGGLGTAWRIKTDCPDGRLAKNDKEILKEYRYGSPFDKDQSVFQPDWSE